MWGEEKNIKHKPTFMSGVLHKQHTHTHENKNERIENK